MLNVTKHIYQLIGFVLVIPFFVDPNNSFLPYNSQVGAIGLGIPLSVALLLILPFLVKTNSLPKILLLISIMFLSYLFILGAFSAILVDHMALGFMIQWMLPVIFFLLFSSAMSNLARIKYLISGMTASIIVTNVSLVAAYGIQVIKYGLNSRIEQNLILTGQYQLYNYTPVGIAMISLFLFNYYDRGVEERWNTKLKWIIYVSGVLAVLFSGARGPLLLFIFNAFFSKTSSNLRILGLAIVSIAIGTIYFTDTIPLRVLAKTFDKDYNTTERVLGSRDTISLKYLRVYAKHLIFGTKLLPPDIVEPTMDVNEKSAHNYYVDLITWTGPIGLFLFLGLLFASLAFYKKNIRAVSPVSNEYRFIRSIYPVLIGVILISSSLRVPLRQPYSAFVFFALFAILLKSLRHREPNAL